MSTSDNIENIEEKAGQVVCGGTGMVVLVHMVMVVCGGTGGWGWGWGWGVVVLVHVGTNNVEEWTLVSWLDKIRTEARIGQIVLSEIVQVTGGKGQECRNCSRLAINTQVQKVCMGEVKLSGER